MKVLTVSALVEATLWQADRFPPFCAGLVVTYYEMQKQPMVCISTCANAWNDQCLSDCKPWNQPPPSSSVEPYRLQACQQRHCRIEEYSMMCQKHIMLKTPCQTQTAALQTVQHSQRMHKSIYSTLNCSTPKATPILLMPCPPKRKEGSAIMITPAKETSIATTTALQTMPGVA